MELPVPLERTGPGRPFGASHRDVAAGEIMRPVQRPTTAEGGSFPFSGGSASWPVRVDLARERVRHRTIVHTVAGDDEAIITRHIQTARWRIE